MAAELSELLVADAAAWHGWLDAFHDQSPGVWLVLHKKGGSITSLTYDQALDEALCFGWIDGQLRGRDAESYLQRMTPRRPKSVWSANNVARIERLESAGRIREAGRRQVDSAQADGRWQRAYAGQAKAELPEDLAQAIAADPAATALLAGLSAANRYALIYRTNSPKTTAGRARAIERLVAMLARGETPHPQ